MAVKESFTESCSEMDKNKGFGDRLRGALVCNRKDCNKTRKYAGIPRGKYAIYR